jgi:hypothetical protein
MTEPIWQRRRQLEKELRDFRTKAMEEYLTAVHYPAVKALVAECEAIGHKPNGRFHFNGLGWSWDYCSQCETRTNITAD